MVWYTLVIYPGMQQTFTKQLMLIGKHFMNKKKTLTQNKYKRIEEKLLFDVGVNEL